MRIAIAGQTFYPGNNGQAIFTIHLAEGLARRGHEVHMLYTTPGFHYTHEIINGVHTHQLRSLDFGWIHPEAFFSFFNASVVRGIFTRFRPDIVHIQDHYFLALDVTAVSRRMGLPIMGTNHFLPENLLPYLHILPLPRRTKIAVLWRLMLMTYNRLDHITTPTQTAAKILCQQDVHVPVTPVSCGVDTTRFHPDPALDRAAACQDFGLNPEKIQFLYVGRLDGEKRIDLLLRGLAQLRAAGRSGIHLAIAGQGAARGELVNLCHSLHLDDRVRFLGYVANEKLPLLYRTCDIFAMPSPEELQSIATLEAMASGRPILAANARALPELVIPGENGCLFAQDSVEQAAHGIAELADNHTSWPRMGECSRARAEAHSLDNTLSRYEDIYQQVIESHHTGSR